MLSSERKGWISLQPGVFMGTAGQWFSFCCEFNVDASVCFLRAQTAPDEKSDGREKCLELPGQGAGQFSASLLRVVSV